MLRRRIFLLVPFLALFAIVATTEERAVAADVATRVEGENFDEKPTGTTVVTNTTLYSPPNGQALKFTNNTATAIKREVDFNSQGDVVLMARGGQSGGSPTLSVNVDGGAFSPAQPITNSGAPVAYSYDLNVPLGRHTIGVKAANTGTGRNPFVDYVTFPASGSGATDTTAPQTTITSPPIGSVIGTTVSFSFTSSEPGSTFLCRLVGRDSTRTNCTSPKAYTNLTVGTQYTFKVWAKDAAGNIDSTPATFTFTPSGSTIPPPSDWPSSDCEKAIKPGQDFDNAINSDPSDTATTFCVYGGTYLVSAPAILKAGDKLKGEPGTVDTLDLTRTTNTATKPIPKAKLVGSGTDNLLRARGTGISISWVDLSGAKGTGTGAGAITAGSAGSDFLVTHSRIHDNASLGISNMKGRVLHTEFFKNSNADSSLGFNGSAVKGITEYEAGYLYVHDEQGNGLWCDVGCSNDPARVNGFWVHDSVVINSNRAGIRYENSPNQALFENNEIHGNGKTELRGGIDIRDSQNATVRNNNLGKAIIAGVTYLVNGNRIGVRATDSGRSDRVNLAQIKVEKNNFGLTNNTDRDRIVTCDARIVVCSNDNTNVGSR